MADISVKLGALELPSPVMAASGTFGFGLEYRDVLDYNKLGAIVTKGVSLKPREGNPMPRIVETPCGMLNSIGLQNPGVESFVGDLLPQVKGLGVPIIVNVFGETVEEYVRVAEMIQSTGAVAGVELNVSCPNVKCGGIHFGANPEMLHEVTKAVREVTDLHLMVKLSPEAAVIEAVSNAAEQAGADSLSAINTIRGMSINIETRKPRIATTTGGLSGPALKPLAVRMVWEASRSVSIPVVGIGGISTAMDAIEFIIAGASAVQVGTANYTNPRACEEIADGIAVYLEERDIPKLSDIVGSVEVYEDYTLK
ncbi:MAG: dihydroorotate dehydrogenase [Candidatus Dadabacteria bacterium]|nr:dihydroorotate dehydrogenase [Candidatus Dadabacteria bacterium]